ncbi:MAG: hypothetical protein J6Q30_03950 [Oscillospiraceae bacterium]|nr:hypothetical protein [Oscillospiraceae bacterium]
MQIVVGVLAAYGLMCVIWSLLGLWLSGGKGWAAVCYAGKGQTAALRRCRWLRSWGLYRGPIFLVSRGKTPEPGVSLARETEDVEICTLEALPARLELEFTYAGSADLTGHRSGGGVSEL